MIQFRRIVSEITIIENIAVSSGIRDIMRFAICMDNEGYEASLELGKIYEVLQPEPNDAAGYIRLVDESGEDYLYNAQGSEIIELPPQTERKLLATLR